MEKSGKLVTLKMWCSVMGFPVRVWVGGLMMEWQYLIIF